MAFFSPLIIGFCALIIACVFLIRYFKAPSVTPDVILSVYFSWVLGFAGILLLPFDMTEALLDHSKSVHLNGSWHFIYWSTFFLAWVMLPIQMAYHTSGAFDFKSKMRQAIMQNLLSYVLSAVGGILYVVIKVSVSKVSITEVIGFLMALGNTYGVLLIIVLMGNGLVDLPRRLWQLGHPDDELLSLYMKAPAVESAFCDARFELEDCEEEVKRISSTSKSDSEIMNMINVIQEGVSTFNYSGRSTSLQYKGSRQKKDETPSTKKGLVDLHKRLIQAQLKVLACDRRWRILLQQAKQLEELTQGRVPVSEPSWCEMQTAPINTQLRQQLIQCCRSSQCDYIRQIWYLHVIKYFSRVLAILCGLASMTILWSEIAKPTNLKSLLGELLIITTKNTQSEDGASFLAQMIIFLALCYMSVCTYWTLFRLNIGWAYTMQGPNLSQTSSLLFNGTYFCRLQFYIGYNFILFLNVKEMDNTSLLSDLMTNITFIPIFGSSFTAYAPIFTVLIAGFALFHGYSRILKLLGIESEDAVASCSMPCFKKTTTDEADLEKINEGKKLVGTRLHFGGSTSNSASTSTNVGKNNSLKNETFSTGNPIHPNRITSKNGRNSKQDDDDDDDIEMKRSVSSTTSHSTNTSKSKEASSSTSSSIFLGHTADTILPVGSSSKSLRYSRIDISEGSDDGSLRNKSNNVIANPVQKGLTTVNMSATSAPVSTEPSDGIKVYGGRYSSRA